MRGQSTDHADRAECEFRTNQLQRPMEYDKVIGGHPKCPKMEMLEQAVNDDPEILKVVKNNEWVFQYLTNETGMNVTCMKHIDYIFDALFIEKVAYEKIFLSCVFLFLDQSMI